MIAFSALFIPLFLLLFILLLFALLFVLGRIAGGKYLRSVMQFLMKVPLLGKALQRCRGPRSSGRTRSSRAP